MKVCSKESVPTTEDGSEIKDIKFAIKDEILYEKPTTKKTCHNEISLWDMYFPSSLIICSALFIKALKPISIQMPTRYSEFP
jgi:hypothetical protein